MHLNNLAQLHDLLLQRIERQRSEKQKRTQQNHDGRYQPYPEVLSPTPSPVVSPMNAPTRKTKKTQRSRRGVQEALTNIGMSIEMVDKDLKAYREAVNRMVSSYWYSVLQNEIFKINPNMPQLGVPMPDKDALTLLKSNNVNDDIPKLGLVPLLYNKNDMLYLGKTALAHSAQILEEVTSYLRNLGQPGALLPEEAAEAIAHAVAFRGTTSFALPKLLKGPRPKL
jgi:hypothetical protein